MVKIKREEYIRKISLLDLHNIDYCVYGSGIMLFYHLLEEAADIDILVLPSSLSEMKKRYDLLPNEKYNDIYKYNKDFEFIFKDFNKTDFNIIDGYPVYSLELYKKNLIKWNREKDIEKIKIIDDYLGNK